MILTCFEQAYALACDCGIFGCAGLRGGQICTRHLNGGRCRSGRPIERCGGKHAQGAREFLTAVFGFMTATSLLRIPRLRRAVREVDVATEKLQSDAVAFTYDGIAGFGAHDGADFEGAPLRGDVKPQLIDAMAVPPILPAH